jgi:hypothetical protein
MTGLFLFSDLSLDPTLKKKKKKKKKKIEG